MSFSSKRKSIVLQQIEADCDFKQWHQDNFEKIKNNKFDSKQWIQPSCDHRTYKYLELLNGIKVVLIYDNKQERKSFQQKEEKDNNNNSSNDIETNGNNYYNVSLCINRGYYSDFKDCPGIAHYCEHMIFMGNTKYPKENAWEDWLSLNGGSANASTYNLGTNYVFDIAPKGKQLLFEALDRFAHNFISPLFNPDSSQRELNAIENEFNLHKTDDGYKQWLVLKDNVKRLDHIPYYKFGSGNKKTLNNNDINDKLIEFHKENYHPNNMSLVILSDIDLNVLEEFVIELFEEIKMPKKIDEIEEEKTDNELYPLRLEPNVLQPMYGTLFRVNSVKEHYTLDIYWMLNGKECSTYYDSSPTTFISELLGHEGNGSLYSILNERNWINSLECGYENDAEGINHKFELFEMNFDLTENGYDHVYQIMDYVFQYLSMLKQELNNNNKIKDYWMESKRLGDIAFNFTNNTNGWDYVESLASRMHQYPIHHLLSCDYIYWTYDVQLILKALNELTPDRCCIMLLSIDAIHYKHKTKHKTNDRIQYIEPILSTKYSIEHIDKSYLVEWNECNNSVFHLPHKNTFIPTNLSLLSDTIFSENKLYSHFLDIESKEKCGPELFVYNECIKIYYKLDRTYFLPKSYITIAFEHHCIWSESGEYTTALSVLIDIFDQYFSKYSYSATLSGLDFEFTQNWRGLKLKLYGYSEKVYPYLKELLHEIKTFKIDSELFETQKKALIRSLKNSIIDCEDHLPYIGRKCIVYHTLTIDKELIAAQNMSMDDIEFVRNLLFEKHDNDLRIYALFTGNIQPNTVLDSSQYLMDIFNIKTNINNNNIAMYNKHKTLLNDNTFLSVSDQRSIRLSFSKCKSQSVQLPNNTVSIYKEMCISPDEDNNGASIVFAMSDKAVDDDDNKGIGMLCCLLRSILSEPFYDSLRSKQQLGYDINVTYETVANIPFIKFQIISSQYDPHYLTLQMFKFINHTFYNEYILDKLRINIKDKIDSAIRSRKIECSSLSSRHNMYWSEIFTYNTLEFDAKLNEVKALQQITLEDIKDLYDTKLLLKNDAQCLILQIWTQKDVHSKDNNIESIQQLKEHMRTDLNLESSFQITQIQSIIPWQNTLNISPNYL